MRRKPIYNSRKDKKIFSRTAMKVNRRNLFVMPMRGGIRL